jgi:hypothetical protein
MSQQVIQKAISISLRLTNIATTAMASGNVNNDALNEALNDIRSTMGAYGEPVSNPVQSLAAPSAKKINMPDIGGALSSVLDIAGNIQNGDLNQTGRIESVNRNLTGYLSAYKNAESRITDLLRETVAGYTPNSRAPSGEMVRQITAAMTANPGHAISSQGNINYAAVERLIG